MTLFLNKFRKKFLISVLLHISSKKNFSTLKLTTRLKFFKILINLLFSSLAEKRQAVQKQIPLIRRNKESIKKNLVRYRHTVFLWWRFFLASINLLKFLCTLNKAAILELSFKLQNLKFFFYKYKCKLLNYDFNIFLNCVLFCVCI